MPTFQLTSLPPELLELITDFCDGFAIGRLYLSGDSRLLERMTHGGGVKRFVLALSSPAHFRWPSLAMKLLHLREFRLLSSVELRNFAFPGAEVAQLPGLIEILELRFSNASKVLFSQEDASGQCSMSARFRPLFPL